MSRTRVANKDLLIREGIVKRRDEVSIDDIVYLDEDIHSYKYFLTGKFDEDARKKYIQDQNAENVRLANQTDSGSEGSTENPQAPAGHSNSFYQKLVSLNEKIGVFKNQFYAKKPRQ